jgi:hypothetical protein
MVLHGFDQHAIVLFASSEFLLSAPAFRQIVRDFNEATYFAIRAYDCREDTVGPKPRSVFAYSPAFAFEPAVLPRQTKTDRGEIRDIIFRSIKARKVLTDDLIRAVTLESLGSQIPTRNTTFGIHHEDCVILYLADNRTEVSVRQERFLTSVPLVP